jgi:hypothetical protein
MRATSHHFNRWMRDITGLSIQGLKDAAKDREEGKKKHEESSSGVKFHLTAQGYKASITMIVKRDQAVQTR